MAAGTIAKPQLRRLLEAKIKTALIGAIAASCIGGVLWKFLIMEPRKKTYADFYKTYDPVKALQIMCDNGLMQSCGPSK